MIEIKVSITREKIEELLQRHSIPVTEINIEKFRDRMIRDLEYLEFESKLAVAREMEYIMYRLLYDYEFTDNPDR
ncbi:MAG: hypothetical protein ACM3PP_12755, partial [Candidatus Saccharibacteria bacterium]